ncbi:fucose isomerase [archaeon]|nr:MAG: fucose isomerase [archaeon]
MPLRGVPDVISPELLYALAKMGHGDQLVIADGNFPSDSVASQCVIQQPVRINGTTAEILKAILMLFPLDQYSQEKVQVMDRVHSDKERNLYVPAYCALAEAAALTDEALTYVERFAFYEKAKSAFVVVQTNDRALYANCIITKGVL